MKYKEVTSLDQIERFIKIIGEEKASDKFDLDYQVCYAVHTCWWCLLKDNPYQTEGLPSDPRGSMLLQAPVGKFIENAKSNPSHYGKHGLKAFMAAYQGNVTTDEGKPTSLDSWDDYNDLIDRSIN